MRFRVAEANDEVLERARSYGAAGFGEIMLMLQSENPAGLAEQLGGLLPRLRAIG